MSAGQGEEIDLSPHVPQDAKDLAARKPNVREAYDTVQATSGDISSQIESAASSNAILDIGSGEYSMSSGVSASSGIMGVVGDGPDAATINIDGSHGTLFDFGGDTFVLEGVTVDITGGDTDAGLANIQYSNECWCEDVTLQGRRDKYAHNGPRMTFLIEGTASTSEGYMHRCQFPDGGTNHPDKNPVGHAIGPNADPKHNGLNVWHECLAANFQDNGFYVAYSPGPNILWNCVSRNNSGGNIRLGENDYVVGGYSESSSTPDDRVSKALEADVGSNIKVVGLEMYGTGDAVHGGGELIQIRSDIQQIDLDRTVAHGENLGTHLARLDEATMEITNTWWYQESTSGTAVQIGSRGSPADVTADGNFGVRAEGADEIEGPITIDGTNYTGTTTAADAGLPDPQPFPSFHFSGAESGVGDWVSDGGSGGGTGDSGGFSGGTGGSGSMQTAGWQNLGAGSGTAVLDTGACGEVTVDVDSSFFQGLGMGGGAGGGGVGGGGEGGVPVRTNFDDMGTIGGGSGYTGSVSPADADATVTSVSGLQSAVDEASSGDTIFIPSDSSTAGSTGLIADGGQPSRTVLELDSPLEFSANEVTLASDRGADGSDGAILRLSSTADSENQSPLIRCIGEACRVTGLTIEGPESGASGDPADGPYATGVWLAGGGCEVDNCEIRAFPTTGVMVQATTAAVHHNTIHDVAQGLRVEQATGSGGSGIVGAGGSGSADCSPAVDGGN